MLAVVTNYYNPARREVKRENFRRFREGMEGLPLFIVEAAHGDQPFELEPTDNVLQVRFRDLIWQQYRLVNLVIQKLPPQFDKAVWVDADILFTERDWFSKMDRLLDQYKIVQGYSEVEMLEKGRGYGPVQASITKVAMDNAMKPTATTMAGNLDLSKHLASGFSWGVRREVIEKWGVYDYWITGSSDTAFAIGIWGDWKNQFLSQRLNQHMLSHYMAWAAPFHEFVGGSVSYLDTRIKHLWHGERNYRKRWRCLTDFDPANDIRVNEDGVFEWCSDKPDMHQCCRRMCLDYDMEFNIYL